MSRIETGPIASDPARRYAETVGDAPRILPLDEAALTPEQLAIIERLRRTMGITQEGEMPAYFRITVKHPALFEAQLAIGTALYAGAIPEREREIAVLRLAWLTQAPYVWGEHVVVAKRGGVTDEEVMRAQQGSSAAGWAPHDAAILRAVEELVGDFAVSDATWNALAARWSEVQLLELPLLVGTYLTTILQQNMLRMQLMAGNIGLARR